MNGNSSITVYFLLSSAVIQKRILLMSSHSGIFLMGDFNDADHWFSIGITTFHMRSPITQVNQFIVQNDNYSAFTLSILPLSNEFETIRVFFGDRFLYIYSCHACIMATFMRSSANIEIAQFESKTLNAQS